MKGISFLKNKIVLLVFCLFMIPSQVFAADNFFDYVEGSITISGIPWGTSEEKILSMLQSKMTEGTDFERKEAEDPFDSRIVITTKKISGFPVIMTLYFDEGKLAKGEYRLNQSNGDYQTNYEDFVTISEQFRNQFGDPQMEYQNWNGFGAEDSVDDPAEAIAENLLWLYEGWWNEKQERVTVEIGNNGLDQTIITYYAPGYEW